MQFINLESNFFFVYYGHAHGQDIHKCKDEQNWELYHISVDKVVKLGTGLLGNL